MTEQQMKQMQRHVRVYGTLPKAMAEELFAYVAALEETVAVLSDNDTVKAIERGLQDSEDGRVQDVPPL